jgi:hypothetical protein
MVAALHMAPSSALWAFLTECALAELTPALAVDGSARCGCMGYDLLCVEATAARECVPVGRGARHQ